ncbi:hypothetical protein KDN34_06405 [Shewanella yunxiaonensis]|uniref:DUF11 domain-containing protein n=1 Tax=Shewanella yunxiaonensis TaxID=2829809 RepID=A0ABX7YWM6_9GAMM|nr:MULTISPECIES: hypothetical protein [Shewanella]MDF0534285.1 hypothetical protein [Shewanella sp. A32]QUN07060.1 hypothetical protein KDN34_06405 [Shewanella yunxiaonensis]
MKIVKYYQLIRTLGIALFCAAGLYSIGGLTPANASFFPQLTDQACMAEQAGFALNCTANDVRVSKVDHITNLDGSTPVECTLGQDVTFLADVTITTTANERYDYSVYLPEGSWSAQDSDPTNTCSILLGKTNGPGVDLENGLDACADISKAAGYSATHVYTGEQITMYCRDDDSSGKAEFNYCMAWHNKEGADCSENDPAAPGTPSKCRCDAFDIDVFVKPEPPTIMKSAATPATHTEPGGEYSFNVNFNNPNDYTPIFLTALTDEIDVDGDGTYDLTINLWGATSTGTTDGVYLTETNCTQPANGGEIAASGSYSCMFKVKIIDSHLPFVPDPQLYKDYIKAHLVDINADPVLDGDSCAAFSGAVDGDHCSLEKTVSITNVPPVIDVQKTTNIDQVPESGADVIYTVKVFNLSGDFDDPVTLTSLMDDKFGDLNGKGSCLTGVSIYKGTGNEYICTFTEFISGTGAGSHTNTVTAKAVDDENAEATDNDSATVTINDIPSAITLEKTANPTSVLETGDDPSVTRTVNYTFRVSVDSQVNGQNTVDYVTFTSLTDDKFGTLTGDCMITNTSESGAISATPLLGYVLYPGQWAECVIPEQLKGNAGDSHVNVATVNGIDSDGQPVTDDDNATVTFTPTSPATDLKFAASMLVVLEMHNAGIENVTLNLLTLGGVDVFPGADEAGFRIINAGGDFDGMAYPQCDSGHELGYNGSATDTYACAFTIEFKPGLENTNPISFLNDVVVQVVDDEGADSTSDVTIQVGTAE